MASYLGPQESSPNPSIRDMARRDQVGPYSRGELPQETRNSPIAEEMRALDAAVTRYRALLERLSPLIAQCQATGAVNANGGPQPLRSVLVQEIHDIRLKIEECNATLDRVEV